MCKIEILSQYMWCAKLEGTHSHLKQKHYSQIVFIAHVLLTASVLKQQQQLLCWRKIIKYIDYLA